MDNMKKVPFDLTLAKQGVGFHIDDCDDIENVWVADDDIGMLAKYFDDGKWWYISFNIRNLTDAFHFIPEEPVKERWAIVQENMIYDSLKIAQLDCDEDNKRQLPKHKFTVVKLAE